MSLLRIAVVTTFFPNPSVPYRTLFVRHLVRSLAERADVRILAPLPYAPPWPPRRRWRALRAVPDEHDDGQLHVGHPRYVVIPKIDAFSGFSYSRAVLPWLRRLQAERPIDVLHAHCAYPDGVGVALAARALGIPLVVTAHGSDLNLDARRVSLRGQMRWALRRAAAVIAVSEDLRRKAISLAPEAERRVSCIPCAGVDASLFQPGDRVAARSTRSLETGARVALFVGNLVPIKALDVLLASWKLLLGAGTVGDADRLILIGDGPLRRQLSSAAGAGGMRGTVRLLGALPQQEVAVWMQAASVLCLSSRQEGMPNVVIEALSCGLPVTATAVGGIPDLVKPDVNGYLAAPDDAQQLAQALGHAFARKWDAHQIAATAAGYNWKDLATRNLEVLRSAAGRPAIK